MCGFAGLIDPSGARRRDELCAAVDLMASAIAHRGPDDSGAWIDQASGAALGFRRLSIIDLTAAGHQPMLSPDGRFVLAFNGEIYNHLALRVELAAAGHAPCWRGHSDSETLLAGCAAWGVRETLERAVGMFGLALWDAHERRLYLARDRFGEKPVYYGWTQRGFVFGSELAALRRAPGFDNPVDRDVVALYAQYSCVPAPYAIYRDIYKLEPGCLLSMHAHRAASRASGAPFAPYCDGGLTVERYWSLPDVVAEGAAAPLRDERAAIAQLEAALSEAVALQSIADVPLGAFLSGGVDSSTIVALMQARAERTVKTYTIGFEEAGYDEAVHAAAVARHLGTDHTELYVSAQQARDVIPQLPRLYSEPFADSSQIPTHLVALMARQHVTVALSGDGGDELFGGYNRYFLGPRVWRGLQLVPAGLRRMAGEVIQSVPMTAWDAVGGLAPGRHRVSRLGDKAHKLAHRLRHVQQVDDLYRLLVTTWPADARLVPGAVPLRTTLDDLVADPRAPRDAASRMMLWDALTYLPDDILHKVDRAAMGCGLETRAPFLDHRVAALAWRMPPHFKIRDGQGKWILRQILYRRVPRELIERPKMGFGIPVQAWLRGPLRDWAEHLLDESRLRTAGYFDPRPIRDKWAEHLSGVRNWQAELWPVLMFQAWQGAA
jgi:asparagine synthase (glutamine-hydrolysing)